MEELLEEIKETEQRLVELKKEYRESKTAALRAALEARNEADALVREEMRNLGYSGSTAGILWRHLR
jgi:vacuolar-type H+-ATPase subunit H